MYVVSFVRPLRLSARVVRVLCRFSDKIYKRVTDPVRFLSDGNTVFRIFHTIVSERFVSTMAHRSDPERRAHLTRVRRKRTTTAVPFHDYPTANAALVIRTA